MNPLFIIPIIFFIVTAIGNIVIAQAIFTTSEDDQHCIPPTVESNPDQLNIIKSLLDTINKSLDTKTPTDLANIAAYNAYISSVDASASANASDASRYEYSKCRKFFFTDSVSTGISTSTNVLNTMRISMVFSLICTFVILIGSCIALFS